jgi:hypothetical protein
MPHPHAHVPHELTEGEERQATPRERRLELCAVVLMSLAAVATAWSGYQAARWSGEQSRSYALASATRIKSQKASSHAGQSRIDDLLYFNGWLNARQFGAPGLEEIYRRRFRPAFEPAFKAWIAQHPFTNPNAIPGPLYMPQYKLKASERSKEFDRQADELTVEGNDAKSNDDKYILSTVFFAAVLFFAGISLRLDWGRLRIGVLGFAAALLGGGLLFVLTLPIA